MKQRIGIAVIALILAACGSSRTSDDDGSTDGTTGVDATTGTDGTDGTDVTDGTDGTTGVDGTSTTAGTDGTNGTDGTSSIDGTTGLTGANGFTISAAQNSVESTGCLDASCMCDFQGGPKACGSSICNLKQNDVLRLSGVVIASKSFYVSATLDGVYIADPAAAGAAFSGVAISYNNEWEPNFEPGDTYNMDVRLKEAFCNTQFDLANLMNLEKVGTAAVPPAQPIDTAVFAAAGADIEKYEGMRVTLTNLEISSHESGNGVMTKEGVAVDDAFSLWFTGGSWQPPPVGSKIIEISGFVTYSFNSYQIQPESAADVKLDIAEKTMTLAEIQDSEASKMCPAPGCAGNGNFCNIEPRVTLTDLIATSDIFVVSASANLRGFFVTSQTAGWSNNAAVVVFDHDDLPIGDSTISEGTTITSLSVAWEEIFCVSQLVLESADDLVTGDAATVPEPATITLSDLSLESGEPWESAIVTVMGPFTVESVNTGAGNGIVTLQAANDAQISASNTFSVWAEGSLPAVGSGIASLTGFVRFFRDADGPGSNWYISPGEAGDVPPVE